MKNENGPWRPTHGPYETSSPARFKVSSTIIPASPDNPTAAEIAEQLDLVHCLSDRLLVAWAMLLRDMTPQSNPRGYLFQQLLRVEIRRRKRAGGAS